MRTNLPAMTTWFDTLATRGKTPWEGARSEEIPHRLGDEALYLGTGSWSDGRQ